MAYTISALQPGDMVESKLHKSFLMILEIDIVQTTKHDRPLFSSSHYFRLDVLSLREKTVYQLVFEDRPLADLHGYKFYREGELLT